MAQKSNDYIQTTEYLNNEFSTHLATCGVERRLTMHDMPQENGVVEWLNCTLLEKMHAMLHSAQLPKHLWEEALMHTTWLKYCTSTKVLEDTMPLEALMGVKQKLLSLHEWGRRVLVHNMSNSKLGS